ncbi:MAG: hypothetical protein Q8P24_18830 [Desulfobacterales bacterium]|nr:hypothetical protein [Desulfobacterales bacterium]
MNWKIWQKKTDDKPQETKIVKLHRPKGIPEPVGRFLVVYLKKDPDWVWKLMSVVRPRGAAKHAFDVRVFDENQTRSKKVDIRDYNSFDAHPELILFEGWYDKQSMKVEIAVKEAKPSIAA